MKEKEPVGPALPLNLLRREPFGGLLFAPTDAVHLELDREAFAFLRDHVMHGRAPAGDEEQQLLLRVQEEIGQQPLGPTRCVDYETDVGGLPFPVYNAPTLADFQITTRCPGGCRHCYAGATPDGAEVSLSDIEHVLNELEQNGISQVAIGGGEPLSHSGFIETLEMCRARGLVPNLTTNGLFFDVDKLGAIKRHCGAIALSLEGVGERFGRIRPTGFSFFRDRLAELLDFQVRTVLQVTLSQENFVDLPDIVDFVTGYPALYGVIFLAYKEVGRGQGFDHTLAALPGPHVHAQLREAFLRLSETTRVGYDCCLTPGIVGIESNFQFTGQDQLEGCSATRSSMGILPSLDVTPCTFTPEHVLGNLRKARLYDIWRGRPANQFRHAIARQMFNRSVCAACAARSVCLGGCPVFSLVRCQYE